MNRDLFDVLFPVARWVFVHTVPLMPYAPWVILVFILLFLLVKWRDSLSGKGLIYRHRWLTLMLHARFWGPLALAALAAAIPFIAIGWSVPGLRFRPTWWPATIDFWVISAAFGGVVGWGLWKLLDPHLNEEWQVGNLWPVGLAMIGGTIGLVAIPSGWPERILISMKALEVALVAAPILVLIALHRLWLRMGREKIINHVEGSAGFASRGEVAENSDAIIRIPIKVSYRGAAEPWNIRANGPLGLTSLEISQDAMWTHVLLVGNSGSGKGMGTFGPILYSLVGADDAGTKYKFILQDVKGVQQGRDAYEKRLGRKAIAWGAAADGLWPSQRWNPIREALDSNDPVGECLALAALIMPDSGGQNDFIPQAGRPLLARMLMSGSYPTLKDLFDDIQDRGILQVAIANDCAPGDINALLGKNMSEWVQGEFKARLGAYADGGWGEKVTSGHDFGLDDFLEVGGYVLSAEALEERKAPLKLMWGMLFRRLLKQQGRKRNLLMLFDEALGSGRTLSRNALNILREDRVSIWAGTQHLDGLREVYGPQEGESLISSFGSKIWLLHGLSQPDKEALSKSLDRRTVENKLKRHGQTEVVMNHGPLLPLNTIGSLARPQKEYWAVFDVQSQSTPIPCSQLGLPILA